ncbi:MAG: ABC transport system permease protein, partial [Microgenomates group bacterium GW2011_GWA2_37_6]
MKFIKIFLLYFQHVMNFRSRIFIWFLTSFLNPLSLMIFWVAVFKDKEAVLSGWSLSSITSYYFLLIIAASFLIVHIEEDVAIRDIREGQLVSHIIKPMSYFWMKFLSELGWRIMQGFFGVLIFIVFYVLFSRFISLPNTFLEIFSAILIISLAFFISFTFKMIVGLTAFWFVDFWGLQQIIEVIIIILAGFIMPIEFFPD